MAKENGSELAMWQGIRRCAMHLRPPAHAGAISSFSYSAAPQLVLTLLLATSCSAVGCGKTNAASATPTLEVEVGPAVQQDVPIFSGWVATLDGYVNAQIQPQVTGYIRRQTYNEGSSAHKGQILFRIDPRTFQALLEQANAQLDRLNSPRPQWMSTETPTRQRTGYTAQPVGQRHSGRPGDEGGGPERESRLVLR